MNSSDAFAEDLGDLYENAPCGYLSLTPAGQVIKANRTLADWLGTDSGTLIGKQFRDVLSFGARLAFETHLVPLLRLKGRVEEVAFDLLGQDGSKVPFIANAAEKRDDSGRHVATRMTLFRAVDRRTYERSLVDARIKAEAALDLGAETAALREQFIAVLGHDLRNPLSALAAGLAIIEHRERLSERGQAVVGEMNSSIKRASDLIADLLDFARGRLGGGLSLDRNSDQPLTPVLEQVVAEIRAIAPERTIWASIDIAEPVYCDRGRIGQLASNLLANALTHGAANVPISIVAATDAKALTLSVSNGGKPIPPEAREQLFQPFFRGVVGKSQHGLGLGLFIVNEIAKAHGGTMDVTSTDGETRFTFTMPLERLP
ncbi:PAS domain-containing sensor histidine kinase [Sphingomonas piscis]|uniref:histidine kinase n=1 Tax=Sphingomonas piscis TaxID=2714943 RepID=A0A6G7YMC5_9SPHN|nr:PAS domain-containing sensor histidine kinase [Sphingomonas piscis]QIK77894.1 PAS domain-containing sensor histidine kinase [Sphingomonas piscis]